MKRTKKILPAICCMPFLWGCASNQTGSQTWNIQPNSSVNIKHAMSNPEAMYRMGRYYQGQKRYEQAIAAYQNALEADPRFVDAMNGLGVIYSLQGKHDEAISQFKAALDIDPNAGHVQNNLGYALYRQGDYAESVAVLEKATTIDPANRKTLSNLEMALAKSGTAEKSVQVSAAAADVPANKEAPSTTIVAQLGSEPITASSSIDDQVVLKASDSNVPAAPQIAVETTHSDVSGPSQFETTDSVVAITSDPGVVVIADMKEDVINDVVQEPAQQFTAAKELHERPVVVAVQKVNDVKTNELTVTNQGRVMPVAFSLADLKKWKVEISNGNGITGMAKKVSLYLKNLGFAANRLTNQKPFKTASTRIYYRSGSLDVAQKIGAALPKQPQLIQSDNMRADIQVKVVLGRDINKKSEFEVKRNVQLVLDGGHDTRDI